MRNPTRVQQQGGGYGGGDEFPFQFSWPGLINYTDTAPGIVALTAAAISQWYVTLQDSTSTIALALLVNGISVATFTGINTDFASASIGPINVASTDVVAVSVTSFGSGASSGLWTGLA